MSRIFQAASVSSTKTTNYTVVAGDNGSMIPVSASSPVTVTLTAAATLGSSFAVCIFNIGTSTVLIGSASTINGAVTLLPGMVAEVLCDGAVFNSYRNTNSYINEAVGATDESLTNPTTQTNSSTTQKRFAYLPVGTIIKQTLKGHYHTTATGQMYWELLEVSTNPGSATTNWGQMDAIDYANSSLDTGQTYHGWRLDVTTNIRATGSSGKQSTTALGELWSGVGNPSAFGYNIGTLQNLDTDQAAPYYSSSGQAFDDTVEGTLRFVFGYTGDGGGFVITGQFIISSWVTEIILPWNG